jgi:hypothetical protein
LDGLTRAGITSRARGAALGVENTQTSNRDLTISFESADDGLNDGIDCLLGRYLGAADFLVDRFNQ